MIPTHTVLKMTLRGEAAAETKTFAKKLKSLKVMFQGKIGLLTEGKEPEQQRQITKEGSEKLKESIRRECETVANELRIHEMAKDTNKYWRLWSKHVERGWIRNVDEQQISDTRSTGRGKVEIITKRTRDEKGRRKDIPREKKPEKTYRPSGRQDGANRLPSGSNRR